jgi:hypothetical protein
MAIRDQPPSMLTLRGLLAPVRRAETRIKEIWQAATRTDGSVIVDHGLFVLMVATFEVMLSDCLRYYLTQRPDKLEFKEEKFASERLLASPLTRDLVPPKVEKKVRDVGYWTLRKAVSYIIRTLDIRQPAFPKQVEEALDALVEIKETRNLLLHNDLIINQRKEKGDIQGCFCENKKWGRGLLFQLCETVRRLHTPTSETLLFPTVLSPCIRFVRAEI